MNEQFTLYSYFRSSASYRVRIALHYKKIPFKYQPVHLLNNGGEQFADAYKKLNPQSQVPCLMHRERPISQSMAIIQYLEDICPEPVLFPHEPYGKAIVIQICEAFNSGIQPLQNLAVLGQLDEKFKASQDDKTNWIHHWNHVGLTGVEALLKKTAGEFCYGDTFTAADCFLVPHVFSAKRFGVDLSRYPVLLRVNEHAVALEAVQLAAPERQPDFTP